MGTLDPLRNQTRQRARTAQRAASQRIAADLVAAAPKDTRQLSRSVRITGPVESGGRIRSTVAIDPARTPGQPNNVAVAAFNEYGTRPHVIRPRRAKSLRFATGGRVVFARKVNHPGTRARPWFYPTLAEWSATIRQAWRSSR